MTSYVRYGCLKDVSETFLVYWGTIRPTVIPGDAVWLPLYVMVVWKMFLRRSLYTGELLGL